MRPEMKRRQDDLAFSEWGKWIESTCQEVTNLLRSRYIFSEVQKMIRANPRIQKSSAFYDWLARVYATDAAIAIRRQLDTDERSVSLARLLQAIRDNPEVLSRKRFLARPTTIFEEEDNETFNMLCGEGTAHIDPMIPCIDLCQLRCRAEPLRRYVNLRIAHTSRNAPNTIPTFADLDQCIDLLEKLAVKYRQLLRHECGPLLRVFPYDWKRIFRQPWIPSNG